MCTFLCEFLFLILHEWQHPCNRASAVPGISITRPRKPISLSCCFVLHLFEPQGPVTASLCEPMACSPLLRPSHRLPADLSHIPCLAAHRPCIPTVSRLCCGHLSRLHAIPPTLASSLLCPEHTRLKVPGISPWRGHRAGPACCVGFVCATPRG